jgi:hypothetical protein
MAIIDKETVRNLRGLVVFLVVGIAIAIALISCGIPR